MQDDAQPLQPTDNRGGQFAVILRQDRRRRLDHLDLSAQLGEGYAQLQTDIAAAYNGQTPGNFRQGQSLGRGQDLAPERQGGNFNRARARRQDDRLGFDPDQACGGLHLAGLGVEKLRPSDQRANTRPFQQGPHAAVQLGDDRILPGDGLSEIELGRRRQGHAHDRLFRRLGHGVIGFGGMDQRLGRNAAAIEAGAAQSPLLDQDDIQPQLTRPDRGHIAAGAASDHQHLCLQSFRLHLGVSAHGRNRVAGCSSRSLIFWTKLAASQPSMMR